MPLLEVLARLELPWWCYARADALVNLSKEAWALVPEEPSQDGLASAPRHPTTACCARFVRERAPTRRSKSPRSAPQRRNPELSFMVGAA